MKINQEMVSKQLQILMVVNFWMGGNCPKKREIRFYCYISAFSKYAKNVDTNLHSKYENLVLFRVRSTIESSQPSNKVIIINLSLLSYSFSNTELNHQDTRAPSLNQN